MNDPTYNAARGIALMVYEQQVRVGAPHEVALEHALAAAKSVFPEVVDQTFKADISTSVVINVGPAIQLTAGDDHRAWLRERKQDISWTLWNRYRQYLLTVRRMPPAVIDRLDEVSDQILGLLENPVTVGRQFDRRGLVMGQVQSGKTTNYSALINKALDSGYRLVVVLAGQLNNLRSQTQTRLDEEVLGFDTALAESTAADHGRFGVGLIRGFAEARMVGSLTTSEENGDFNSKRARTRVDAGGSTPFVLVVKKNGRVLKHLLEYLRDHSPYSKLEPLTGRTIVPDVPLLVIDDEADQATVNTSEMPVDEFGKVIDDYNPTTINRLIRQLLRCFTQTAYVGYTATPFANIFIHDEATHAEYGEDLFPRSFIVSLRAPENYVGPELLLGIPDSEPMPVFRSVEDQDRMVPDRHRIDYYPQELAPSLERAIQAFLLATAERRLRGQSTAHNSMLIHVTRFVSVQNRVADLVKDYVTRIQRRFRYGEGAESQTVLGELADGWRDFESTSATLGARVSKWLDIERELPRVLDLTTIRVINGSSSDLLDYRENEGTGISVIAVGGDKLSRGLTLEGLTVSYFLRASQMYDTLMQMGRWFGYRDGYADLIRIYTTPELQRAYEHIARASEELRQEFEYMVSIGATPREFGLRVRAHPTMMITSPLKMRQGERLRLSYQGDISESTVFDKSPVIIRSNLQATQHLLGSLGPHRPSETGNFVWDGVSVHQIIDFLERFATHRLAPRADSRRLASFIKAQNKQDPSELTEWTVALISKTGAPPDQRVILAGSSIGLTDRTAVLGGPAAPLSDRFTIRRLLSPPDEALDLNSAERVRALEITEMYRSQAGKEFDPSSPPSGKAVRQARPPSRGLVLLYPLNPVNYQLASDLVPIGIGLSFPTSNSGATIDYVVNRIWRDEEPDYELL
jgi:Z1 domain-containing protein